MTTPPLKLGILLWNQASGYPAMRDAALRIDRLGYEHLWAWDHLYAIYGDPYQPILEGWSLLDAWAEATERIRLGLLVGANTFRNPALVAKLATTLDHVSGGRAILGLGGAWFELEHVAHGIDFGTGDGERLDRLDEAVGIIRRVLDGEEVTHEGRAYRTDHLVGLPRPIQPRLPILIGGGGEKKTLRTVAKYADYCNLFGGPATLLHKDEVLRRHCAEVGRDQSEIERSLACKIVIRDTRDEARRAWAAQMAHNRTPESEWDDAETLWLGTPVDIAETIRARMDVGFGTIIVEMPAPYDVETIERLIGEVKPMVEARVERG
jgi:F420-dependent oxidoreductase-like protein